MILCNLFKRNKNNIKYLSFYTCIYTINDNIIKIKIFIKYFLFYQKLFYFLLQMEVKLIYLLN